MASDHEVAKTAPKVSAPNSTSYSLLPKRLLSHKWIVRNAKDFLQPKGSRLRSGTFSAVMPQNMECTDDHHLCQTSMWCLDLEHVQEREWVRGSYTTYLYIVISLIQCEVVPTSEWISCKVSIPKCMFSLLQTDMEEPILQHNESVLEHEVNKSERVCCSWKFLFENLDELSDGTLIVQVDANLYSHLKAIGQPEALETLENVVMGMKSMFADKLFTDLTIKCGGEEFKVHKAVLASQSPFFRRMLESDVKEQRTSVIEISDTDPQVISNLLTYLYTGKAPDVDTLANDLLVVANKYTLSLLFAICESKLKLEINDTNFIDLLLFADSYNADNLRKACLIFIYCNSPAVYNSSRWKEFKQNSAEHVPLLMEILEFAP